MKKISTWVVVVILLAVCGVAIWQSKGGVVSVQEYKDPGLGFSFNYPENYKISATLAEDGGQIIVATVASSTLEKSGFQILINPSFSDEPDAVITKERIVTDIPDLKIENAQEVELGSVKGLQFESDNTDFDGTSFEIWFVKGENLYQMSGYTNSKDVMENVIKSWKF